MTLNELSKKYWRLVSLKRFPNDMSIDIIKHLASEVVEVTQSFADSAIDIDSYLSELCDVVLCIVALFGRIRRDNIDFEKYLKRAIYKNADRIDRKDWSDELESFIEELGYGDSYKTEPITVITGGKDEPIENLIDRIKQARLNLAEMEYVRDMRLGGEE